MSLLLVLMVAPLAASPVDPLAPLSPPKPPVAAERVVRRGETITLHMRKGPLTISTAARALGDAAAGQRVRVTIAATRRTMDAVAEAPGLARLTDH